MKRHRRLGPGHRQRLGTGGPAHPLTGLEFLAYLLYLRAMRPAPSTDQRVVYALISITGLILLTFLLLVAGAPDLAASVVRHWPFLP